MLPKRATLPQGWSGAAACGKTHVQRQAWEAAGFDAALIAGADRVRFTRAARTPRTGLAAEVEGGLVLGD